MKNPINQKSEGARLQKRMVQNEPSVDYKSPMPVRQQAYVSQQPEQATPVRAVVQPAASDSYYSINPDSAVKPLIDELCSLYDAGRKPEAVQLMLAYADRFQQKRVSALIDAAVGAMVGLPPAEEAAEIRKGKVEAAVLALFVDGKNHVVSKKNILAALAPKFNRGEVIAAITRLVTQEQIERHRDWKHTSTGSAVYTLRAG